MTECSASTRKVVGSNPTGVTYSLIVQLKERISPKDKVPGLSPGGATI